MMLETKRLLLRPWRESDAQECFRYASDPDVGPIAGWPPHTNIDTSRLIIKEVLSVPETYAIVLKETDLPIGCIALKMGKYTDLTDKKDECELGFWLGKPYWGQGIMPEASEEILRHGFEDLGMRKIWCGYYDGNNQSRRVQEKLGFIHQWTRKNVDVPLMHEKRTGHVNCMTREEWKGRK
jgi:RimJ/RimL family protein N-acetyltransferase